MRESRAVKFPARRFFAGLSQGCLQTGEAWGEMKKFFFAKGEGNRNLDDALIQCILEMPGFFVWQGASFFAAETGLLRAIPVAKK